MARKKKNAKINFRIQALKVPRGIRPDDYLRALLRSMETGSLPRGLDVQLHWQNPETRSGRSKGWQSDAFLEAVADSSEGFNTLLRRVIQRRLHGSVVPRFRTEQKRKAAKKKKPVRKPKAVAFTARRPSAKRKTVKVKTKRKAVLRDARGRFKARK